MIVKFFSDGVWGYIDNVRQVANKPIDYDELVEQYNNDPEYQDDTHAGEKDIASYMDGEKLPDDIAYVNKVFLMAINNQENWGHEVNTENLLDPELMQQNYPAAVILMYVEEHKEHDSVALITNQKCFLMNDKGQTIERLV